MSLTITALQGIKNIQPGDDLAGIIATTCQNMGMQVVDGDIFVLAQKIVSKAEKRMVNLTTVTPTARAIELAQQCQKDARLVELILQESNEVVRVRPGVIVVEHRCGFICANAGIDHSNVESYWGNAEDWVLLLPEDADQTACTLRDALMAQYPCQLGVMIIDSHGRAWRMGTEGVCIGLAGMPALVDLRGQKDLFNYALQHTQVGVADELAAAASLVMGQADEGTPVVHVKGFPYTLRAASVNELIRPKELDMFR